MAEPQREKTNPWPRRIALLCAIAIGSHLLWRYGWGEVTLRGGHRLDQLPLFVALACGLPLLFELLVKAWRREFGSDLLAGLSIVTSILLGEYLAGALVVLMLSGGQALEAYAARSASSALGALTRRMPSKAHRRTDGTLADVPLDRVSVGDVLVVFPHETCPVDGTVLDGHGVMDESYLTGEPYLIPKTPGAAVLSGAINGQAALTIRAARPASDSRYARIMSVLRDAEQRRPRLRRLGDQLGALYTPLAVAVAVGAWAVSGEPVRFLAVLVVATPCPLLIAIPVAIVGAISLSARRGIVVKDPAILEKLDVCRTAIFDKTGTLTYGKPALTELLTGGAFEGREVLGLVGSLERYSKHPLAAAVLEAARQAAVTLQDASEVSEPPGAGLRGVVAGREIQVSGRQKVAAARPDVERQFPPVAGGLECVVLIDGRYAATLRFRDLPREDGASFVRHLGPRHLFDRVLLVSGDRESEVRHLAEQVGIEEVYAGQTPEEKLAIVRRETARAGTVFLGDGVNDAPALTAATVGIAFGPFSDATAEAAGAVILEPSLGKVDELLHVGRRLRAIALQSAVGGMALSLIGMALAAAGYLPPVAGAVLQEVIDVFAVVNALRVALPPATLTDYHTALTSQADRPDTALTSQADASVRPLVTTSFRSTSSPE